MSLNKDERGKVYQSLGGIINNQHIIYEKLEKIQRRTFWGAIEFLWKKLFGIQDKTPIQQKKE